MRRLLILVLLLSALVFGRPMLVQAADGRALFPLTSLRERCIEFPEVKIGTKEWEAAECAVSEFDSFGSIDNENYYYALYCLIPNYSKDTGKCGSDTFNARYHRSRGLAVFVQQGADKARLLFERADSEIGVYVYDKPEFVQNAAGTILVLKIRIDGTGAGNASEYYIRKKGTWQRIESESWFEDVKKKIPAGLEIWKGGWPDMETMTARAGLYRKGDANCCPTGGTAYVQLAIEDDRFVVKSIKIERE